MSFALLYWILMLLWLVFGIIQVLPKAGQPFSPSVAGGSLLLFILLLLLGWKVFQAPLHT